MVGDRENDVEGAKTFGIASLGVRCGYAAPGELERAGADFIADTVGDMRDFLMMPMRQVCQNKIRRTKIEVCGLNQNIEFMMRE